MQSPPLPWDARYSGRLKDDMGGLKKMMTSDEIQAELGWSREMIYTLLPESRGWYRRELLLAVAKTPEAITGKRRWDETVRDYDPAPDGPCDLATSDRDWE
jgi:hypothetical protein